MHGGWKDCEKIIILKGSCIVEKPIPTLTLLLCIENAERICIIYAQHMCKYIQTHKESPPSPEIGSPEDKTSSYDG